MTVALIFARGCRQSCLIFLVLFLSDFVIAGRKVLQELRSCDWKFVTQRERRYCTN